MFNVFPPLFCVSIVTAVPYHSLQMTRNEQPLHIHVATVNYYHCFSVH